MTPPRSSETGKEGTARLKYQCEITAPFNGPSRREVKIYSESGKFHHYATCNDEADAALIVEAVNERDSLKAERDELKEQLERTKKHDTLEISQLQAERVSLRAESARLRGALEEILGLIDGGLYKPNKGHILKGAAVERARAALKGGGK